MSTTFKNTPAGNDFMGEMSFKHVELAIYHKGCFSSKSSEKFPDVKLSQASPITVLKEGRKSVIYNILWDVRAPSKSHLNEYFGGVKSFRELADLKILKRNIFAGKKPQIM